MEYVNGGDLFDAIEQHAGGEICDTERKCAQIVKGILQALLYLHKNGIVHRDIKPENVLLQRTVNSLNAKLADFGLSAVHDPPGSAGERMVMSRRVGTPHYFAPELAREWCYDEKVDLWAVGIVAYWMLTGDTPHSLDIHRSIVVEKLKRGDEVQFPEHLWLGCTEEAESFVKSLLTINPDDRLSASEALEHPWISKLASNPPVLYQPISVMVDSGNENSETQGRIERERYGANIIPWRAAFKPDGEDLSSSRLLKGIQRLLFLSHE